MSRQAGSIVRGISKPRRISVKTGRQQVRLCTAGTAKGQGSENRGSGICSHAPGLDRSKSRA